MVRGEGEGESGATQGCACVFFTFLLFFFGMGEQTGMMARVPNKPISAIWCGVSRGSRVRAWAVVLVYLICLDTLVCLICLFGYFDCLDTLFCYL